MPNGAKFEVVLIGASTGGPEAISKFISGLGPNHQVPIILTVHMAKDFVQIFADRLAQTTKLRVAVASDGSIVKRADVWVAPWGSHMLLRASDLGCTLTLDHSAPVHSCRPSVDMLFKSASLCKQVTGTALLLTGIGSDGADGCAALKKVGWRVYLQDEASSVVWGMPGAAHAKGAFSEVLDIGTMTERLNDLYFGQKQKAAR